MGLAEACKRLRFSAFVVETVGGLDVIHFVRGVLTRGAMTLSARRQAIAAAQCAGGGSPQGLGWLCRGGVGQRGSVAHFQPCGI